MLSSVEHEKSFITSGPGRKFINSFLASNNLSHLLKTFVNSLDPVQDRQNVGPDLDPNHLTL